MGDVTSTSSPLSSVSCSPVKSANSNGRSLPFDRIPATREHITSKAYNDDIAVALQHTSPTAPRITVPETDEDQAAKQSNKRDREEHAAEDDEGPKRKKTATIPDVKAAESALVEVEALYEDTVRDGDDAAVEDGTSCAEELAAPNIPAKPVKKAKAAPKKKAAPSRRGPPACAECRRRKVKCKHNLIEESTAAEAEPAINSTPDDAANTANKATKPTKVDKNEALNDDEPDAGKRSKKSSSKEKPAPKLVRAPPERTSTRNRKAPERFEDLQEMPSSRASPPRKGTSKVFDPYYITTNSTSRLGRADIYHLLLEEGAWTSLPAEQQTRLIAMLPNSPENQRLLEKIKAGETGKETRPQWLKESNVFRDEVAEFKKNLTNGHLGKTWQAAAEQAVAERAAGEYDAWKAEEAELWWGQKSK
ncbi:hypothetical protein E8E12_006581 [Didymella heteroderae]|uniref:ASX DEUBAD domain-containing protein n=1 Tax=Didymella heteroderae TaxID=1769908 RepID=A0A9P5BYC9_9PLEO|nr:hypothetical protein E8E12_006581 [Didymella heteroderae]